MVLFKTIKVPYNLTHLHNTIFEIHADEDAVVGSFGG